MLKQPISVTFNMGDGPDITIGTGLLARQADGAVTVQQGNCVLLATVCASTTPREGQDFFPLSVDYQEKFASAGRIPGSFFKREGKLNDYEILTSRLVDRALRPLFPDDYFCEVQVLITLVSSDPDIMPDSLACLAASSALAVSDVPVQEIISEVRIGSCDGQFIVNPSRTQMKSCSSDFMIGATAKNLMMVEGEAKECSEEDLINALQVAHDAIRIQIKAQEELREKAGVKGKRDYPKPVEDETLRAKVEAARSKVHDVAAHPTTKEERSEAFAAICDELIASLGDEPEEQQVKLIKKYYEHLTWEVVRGVILDEGVRLDGRKVDQIRPLSMEVDALPTPHGSALFTRGETQALATVTMGTDLDQLLIESAAQSEYAKFILHYNFPPFCTGEIGKMRGPGRREVGHGNLAMRSLKQMVPTGEVYPYTTRVVSDIMSSNGSSSMATVCAGSLALMDAGVPMPKHVAGVAMGLISREADNKYAILTDILGDEDHLGDMDFKVTGTRDGICGVQMDIKVDGLSMETMREALGRAHAGRHFILDKMYACIEEPRKELKPQTPRMVKIPVDKDMIGTIIGPGGKMIQEIQRVSGTTVNIEETPECGMVSIFSPRKEGLDKAVELIKGLTAIPQVGDIYDATVKSIKEFGAFVEFLPKKEGLLHISEITWDRLDTMDGVYKEGDKVQVKLLGIDARTGKFRLSHKVLTPKPEGYQEPAPRPSFRSNDRPSSHRDRPDQHGFRGPRTGNFTPRPPKERDEN